MKRILSAALTLVLLLALCPVGTIQADALVLDVRVEAAIQWAIATANDNTHGYSQSNRTGPNYDCSSFVSTAFRNGGFTNSATLNTRTIANAFKQIGFTQYSTGSVTIQRGDVLLKSGHVELYLGDNTCVAAHDNYDGVSGDGNGKEIEVRYYTACSFCRKVQYTSVLRYEGPKILPTQYTFDYNGNGGALNANWETTVLKDEQFEVFNVAPALAGYTFIGWNAKRNNDNKWLVDGRGWMTEDQISAAGCTKKLFLNKTVATMDDTFIGDLTGNGSYTFYAVWFPVSGEVARGDIDTNGFVEINDAIYLLYHVNFQEDYPITQSGDMNGDGKVDLDDTTYLLYHANFPEDYPLR